MNKNLKGRVREFPQRPGVYMMRDPDGVVVYVGKAKNLRSRVRSYFSADRDVKTTVLMSRVEDISYLVTANEYEALLLENNLIKEHHPRYNINLKDGKSYPVIRITADEYPRVFRTRRIIQDGSLYFGPYTSVQTLERYLELIDRLFPLRKCKTPKLKPRPSPCLYYHIGRCAAVCAGKTAKDEYLQRVEGIKRLLNGQTDEIKASLRTTMHEAAAEQKYEKAADLRDSIKAIEQIESEQNVVDFDPEVRDYIGYAARDELCVFVVFQMRSGKLIGSHVFSTSGAGSDEENLEEFVLQFYSSTSTPPRHLFTSSTIADSEALQRFFAERLQARVRIHAPETTREAAVLRLTTENARQELEKRVREKGDLPALKELERLLDLPGPPLRIEGFDIAQVGGQNTVASLVSFNNGVPDKSNYRRYRIRTLKAGQIDDYGAMREAVARRYTRVKNEKLPKPDLILIDGGMGQLNAALEILTALEMQSIPVIGLAKRNEEIYLPGRDAAVTLPEGSPPLRVLQHVRDEAHRFATTYRASLQTKEKVTSVLERVPGIGPRRAGRILKSFDSMVSLVETPVDIVAKSVGITEELAGRVQETVKSELLGE